MEKMENSSRYSRTSDRHRGGDGSEEWGVEEGVFVDLVGGGIEPNSWDGH